MPPLSKWHVWWIIGLSLVCVLLSASVWRRHTATPGRVTLTDAPPRGRSAPGALLTPVDGPIYVHVTGEIARPGLYRLPAGTRVMDAISYAGGATLSADMDALNLATPLRDGQKLTVPTAGQDIATDPGAYLTDSPAPAPLPPVLVRADPPAAKAAPGKSVTSALMLSDLGKPDTAPRKPSSTKLRRPGDGTVDINSATLAQLQRLPGVGPATARKIADYRDEHGGFSTAEELMEVKGIGPSKLRKMQPFIVLHDSP